VSAYTAMIREIAADGARVNRHGEMLGDLTAAELVIAYAEHSLEADNCALDKIGDLREWCATDDPQTALAKLRSLRMLIDESLLNYVSDDVRLEHIPDDHDSELAYAASEADSQRNDSRWLHLCDEQGRAS